MPEIFSERKSNRAGVQAGCRHLIEQSLELVIIVLVDQYKLKPTPTQAVDVAGIFRLMGYSYYIRCIRTGPDLVMSGAVEKKNTGSAAGV